MMARGVQPCPFVYVLSMVAFTSLAEVCGCLETGPQNLHDLLPCSSDKVCQPLDCYMFTFIRSCPKVFLKWLLHFILLPAMNGNSLSTPGVANLFNFSHFGGCEVLSHCSFNLQWLDWPWEVGFPAVESI